MKHIYLAAALILATGISLTAQTLQKGKVVEYNESKQKKPLPGVEVDVKKAQATVTDNNGNFVLKFNTAKPGERILYRTIRKSGYDLFNKDALEQWNLNPNYPFTIEMINADRFRKMRETLYDNSAKRYRNLYEKGQKELARLKKEGKLREKEHEAKLKELEETYEKQMDNLENYVDRFSRIDYSELSEKEAEIVDLLHQGLIDEAIKRYEEHNPTEIRAKGIKARQKIEEEKEKITSYLDEKEQEQERFNEEALRSVERQITSLQLAGGRENQEKAKELYVINAEMDTTNTGWLLKTSEFLYNYGDYNEASRYNEIALGRALRSNDKEKIIKGLFNKGMILMNSARYSEAEKNFLQTAEIQTELYGPDNVNVAKTYNALGLLYFNLGEAGKAKEVYDRAVNILIADPSEENVAILGKLYNNIGLLYFNSMMNKEALEWYKKAYELAEKEGYEKDAVIATILSNISMALYNLQQYDQSLQYLEQANAYAEKSLPSHHPLFGSIENNKGMDYQGLGEYPKAREAFKKAFEIYEQALGPDHPNTALVLGNLGYTYILTGEFQKGIPYLEQSIRLLEENNGLGLPIAGTLINNLGTAYIYLEDFEKAISLFQMALRATNDIKESIPYNIMLIYSNLGWAYCRNGEFDKGMEYEKTALEIAQNNPGLNPYIGTIEEVMIAIELLKEQSK